MNYSCVYLAEIRSVKHFCEITTFCVSKRCIHTTISPIVLRKAILMAYRVAQRKIKWKVCTDYITKSTRPSRYFKCNVESIESPGHKVRQVEVQSAYTSQECIILLRAPPSHSSTYALLKSSTYMYLNIPAKRLIFQLHL